MKYLIATLCVLPVRDQVQQSPPATNPLSFLTSQTDLMD
ncbi:hypothetical protein SynA1560_02432 [Synechococcus sp. A15-60]|nr:hypothetical protein SynA1560_02432 [Synechococcus sp. A15-60]